MVQREMGNSLSTLYLVLLVLSMISDFCLTKCTMHVVGIHHILQQIIEDISSCIVSSIWTSMACARDSTNHMTRVSGEVEKRRQQITVFALGLWHAHTKAYMRSERTVKNSKETNTLPCAFILPELHEKITDQIGLPMQHCHNCYLCMVEVLHVRPFPPH